MDSSRTRSFSPAILTALALMAAACSPQPEAPPPDPVARGAYLVTIGGCDDCHTPKVFTEQGPAPDSTRRLSGHPADVPVPAIPRGVINPTGWLALTNGHLTAWAGPWGVSFSSNLTPDPTGLGAWTVDNFVQAMRTGQHMGSGRPILPPMPWHQIAQMTDEDLQAVFAYLRTVPAVSNAVPAPVAPAAGR